jgi:hypothetical protein
VCRGGKSRGGEQTCAALFDHLVGAHQGTDLQKLSTTTSVAERGARNFFDALVSLDLPQRDKDGRYSNTTETALYLDANKPTYISQELIYLGERMYPHWNLLAPTLKSGKPQNDNQLFSITLCIKRH